MTTFKKIAVSLSVVAMTMLAFSTNAFAATTGSQQNHGYPWEMIVAVVAIVVLMLAAMFMVMLSDSRKDA